MGSVNKIVKIILINFALLIGFFFVFLIYITVLDGQFIILTYNPDYLYSVPASRDIYEMVTEFITYYFGYIILFGVIFLLGNVILYGVMSYRKIRKGK